MGAALGLALLLVGVGTDAPELPAYAARFPYAAATTSYGEINGSVFYSASGETIDSPKVAVEKMDKAFAEKNMHAFKLDMQDIGMYWQWRGVLKIDEAAFKKSLNKIKKVSAGWAVRLNARFTPGLGQALELFDLLCSMDVKPVPEFCPDIEPAEIAAAAGTLLPQAQWHSVRFDRGDKSTRWNWSIWPKVEWASLFAWKDPKAAVRLCSTTKFPVPSGRTQCRIVARFIKDDRAHEVLIADTTISVSQSESFMLPELESQGWVREEMLEDLGENGVLGAVDVPPLSGPPGFIMLRKEDHSLMLAISKSEEGGSRIIVVES